MIDAQRTVGELVTERPGRARVFERLGIDYCCGGKRPLSEACAKKELDAATVVAMLEATEEASAGDAGTDWTQASLAALCDHIVGSHHAYLREELPRLAFLTDKVATAHGNRHAELLDVRDTFAELSAELGIHMLKEEYDLFPACRRLEHGEPISAAALGPPIAVMEDEHAFVGAALERLHELTQGYEPPADACNSYRAMLDGLSTLERDLHEHIHEENNILFPRAAALAEAPAVARAST